MDRSMNGLMMDGSMARWMVDDSIDGEGLMDRLIDRISTVYVNIKSPYSTVITQ